MTTTAARTTTWHAPADPTRNDGRGYARAGGIFYLLTFAASIPALLLLDPILNDPGYIVGAGHDTQVVWACFLDFVNALAGIGSAVAVFPVVKRVNESTGARLRHVPDGRGGRHPDRRRRPAHRGRPSAGPRRLAPPTRPR